MTESRPSRRSVLGVLLSAALVACGESGDVAPHALPTDAPNLILVTVDTLRADHLDAYGYALPTAPVFSKLAAAGVRFEHALSQAPWTLPSMASLHTALYPRQHGAIAAETALPEAAQTLAETLQAAGYRTLAVVSHDFVGKAHGFAQGFDVFDESHIAGHGGVTSPELTAAALEHLEGVRQPFFLWVHYFDPHYTYVPHPEVGFAGEVPDGMEGELSYENLLLGDYLPVPDDYLDHIRAVYDEEIHYTDEWIGRLWDGVNERTSADRNILIYTADHGEAFRERGRMLHGKDVYEELVHVPLLIAGAIPEELRGTVVNAPVETRHIPKTVVGMLGLGEDPFSGIDLLDLARGGRALPVFTEGLYAAGADQRKHAVVDGGWKLIHHLDDDRYELYDLANDPLELHDAWQDGAPTNGPDVAALLALLERFETLPHLATQPVGLDPEAIERLKAMGYIH